MWEDDRVIRVNTVFSIVFFFNSKDHVKSMMGNEANEKLECKLSMCRLGRTRRREGAKSGAGRLERMKRGYGIFDRFFFSIQRIQKK